MEFGKAFTFAFEDRDWLKKIGIGGLLLLIPLIGSFFLLGWVVELVRRVILDDPEPLPDWSNLMDFLVKGFQAWVISLVYSLPVVILSVCTNSVPILLQGNGGDDTMATIVALLSICFGCVIFLFSLALGFILPAALGQFAATGQMGAAFRFSEVFALVRAEPMAFLLTLLGSVLASIVASLGIILCIIGVIFTSAWAATVTGHLYGQAYKKATASRGMPASPAY